jgi:hypothetical protein
MSAALALQLIMALLGDMPTIIKDVEDFIATLKARPGASLPRIGGEVQDDTREADRELSTPIAP